MKSKKLLNFVSQLVVSTTFLNLAFFQNSALSLTPDEERILKTEINLLLQSVIIDNEIILISSQFPDDSSSLLTYSGLTDNDSWSGTLTGIFAGLPVNVTYNGILQGDPELAYDGQGTLGTNAYSSSGRGTVTLGPENPVERTVGITVNPFRQQLGVSGTVSNGVVSASISAIKDFDGDERRNEGFLRIETSVGVFSVPGILPAAAEGAYNFDLFQRSLNYEDGVEARFLFGLIEKKSC